MTAKLAATTRERAFGQAENLADATLFISVKVWEALVKGADNTGSIPEPFHPFALRDSKLDPSGCTAVRDPELSAEPLKIALLRLSENGRMLA